MGVGSFLYLNGNYAGGIVDHAVGAKSSIPWSMAGIGTDFLSMGQLIAHDGTKLLAKSAAASGSLGAAESLANFSKAVGTPIINAGLITLTMESNLLGFGRPEDGERFTRGANHFMDAYTALLKSRPPGDWHGSGSTEYGDRNKEQQTRASDLHSKDVAIQKELSAEAGQVSDTRDYVSKCQTKLAAAIIPAIAAKFAPWGGPALAMAIEFAAVAATVYPATKQLNQLINAAGAHARAVKSIASEYESIASNAKLPGAGFGNG
ncbi:EspA/EspE family type VII secretion system effector [Mycolicibacterium peregrinum]|uniref:EspA/EspE family type VII secretion system effector n=1 Tax=Mycolicibacterium peregrinum TaxID=43304 RepID=UPI003AAEB35E